MKILVYEAQERVHYTGKLYLREVIDVQLDIHLDVWRHLDASLLVWLNLQGSETDCRSRLCDIEHHPSWFFRK